MSVGLFAAVQEAAEHHELPMSPLAYGLIAGVGFTVLLLVTFAFRGVANRWGTH